LNASHPAANTAGKTHPTTSQSHGKNRPQARRPAMTGVVHLVCTGF
jgi:hypothetical protein